MEQQQNQSGPSPITRAIQNSGQPKSPQQEHKIPPKLPGASIHEGVLPSTVNIDGRKVDLDALGVVGSARAALREERESLTECYEALVLIAQDPTLTPEDRALQSYDLEAETASLAQDRLYHESQRFQGFADERRKKMADAARQRAGATAPALATEIRQHVRSLSEANRQAFLHRAAQAGDVRTLEAVLDAPLYLSGVESIKPEAAAKLRERAARVLCPEMADQVDAFVYVANRLGVAAASVTAPTETAEVARTRKLRDARVNAPRHRV